MDFNWRKLDALLTLALNDVKDPLARDLECVVEISKKLSDEQKTELEEFGITDFSTRFKVATFSAEDLKQLSNLDGVRRIEKSIKHHTC